jgi:hypothetical protein
MPSLSALPPVECWARLEAVSTAMLAFAHEGDVHVVPVNICVRDRQVWFRTGEGVKRRAARAGVRMAVALEQHDDLSHGGWSVAARGPASLEPDGPPTRGRPTVRPWRRQAQEGDWVRVAVDTIEGRQLVLGAAGTAAR